MINANTINPEKWWSVILIRFPEGSSCIVPVSVIITAAVKRLAVPGLDPNEILREQLMPAIQEKPELLLEILKNLSWSEIKPYALSPFWVSTPKKLQEQWTRPEGLTLLLA